MSDINGILLGAVTVFAGSSVLAAVASNWQESRLKRKAMVADAIQSALKRVEMYYRVRRRSPDKSDDVALRDRFHTIQEDNDHHAALLAMESPWAGFAYRKFLNALKKELAPHMASAWQQNGGGPNVQLRSDDRPDVDIVPTRPTEDSREVPIRKDDRWTPSDAKSFADWFNGLCDERPKMRQIGIILKRLRDLNNQEDNLKSITILTLVAKYYTDNGSLMSDLVAVLDEINSLLKQPNPVISNPVNEGEDLMDGVGSVDELKNFFETTVAALDDAIADDDGKALEDLFGYGFKSPKTTAANSIVVTPLVAAMRAYGIE